MPYRIGISTFFPFSKCDRPETDLAFLHENFHHKISTRGLILTDSMGFSSRRYPRIASIVAKKTSSGANTPPFVSLHCPPGPKADTISYFSRNGISGLRSESVKLSRFHPPNFCISQTISLACNLVSIIHPGTDFHTA